jgi:hypothetical protein
MNRVIVYLAAAIAFSASAIASDFGPMPSNYESAAQSYILSRLDDPHAARFIMSGEPYTALIDLNGRDDLPCWAVDMRVKSRLPYGGVGGYVPMTVLFHGGRPVALKDDVQSFARARDEARLADLN